MAYLSLAHGVQGMLWWGGVANDAGNVLNWPEEAGHFRALVGEVRHLSAMLLAPEAPVEIEVLPAGVGMHMKVKMYEGKLYVIAVNANEELPMGPMFKLPAGYERVHVLFEDRSMKLEGDSFRDLFEASGVHVYRIQ